MNSILKEVVASVLEIMEPLGRSLFSELFLGELGSSIRL